MGTSIGNVPLLALSIEARTILSTMLNPLKILPTEGNLPRDWRGVAEMMGVPFEKMPLFEAKADPFKEVFNFCAESSDCNVNVADLTAFLAVVDRFDVMEDTYPVIQRDVDEYLHKISQVNLHQNVQTLDTIQDSSILTYEDSYRAKKKLPLCRYDAFILYSEEDASFASNIIERMEGEYSLKLCSKDRDLLPGLKFEHEVIGKMIEERCNRLLVILSPSFLESNANQFLVSYAQAVALDTRCRKIIPCVYKKCELPPSVRYSFCIDYNRSGKLWNFWDKLSQSLNVASQNKDCSPDLPTSASKQGIGNGADTLSSISSPSFEWWDSEKPNKSAVREYLDLATSKTSSNSDSQQFDEHADSVSLHSQAHLLPNKNNGSKSKWLSKIMSPISGKKRGDKEKSKPKPIAE
ncbi:Myeloid differentiation primary response protein MyD88 [Orchesella cincta]|uniref:Myeloid differentiation primary response protein MyD88 n=1 Tax=Orchesella cincta TaxID=48709 RepID=A0A1D2N2Y0_ORCCI|nr:Myeloid differentiation primary response protein MyD88 [Orchesella cincta]